MTATSSQGLALMAEVVYVAASQRAPIVVALGNRALSGPINIHCDHSDSMLVRDSGVVQLFAESAQEVYDLMLLAPRIAEHPDVRVPVFVCQDGFTVTHSSEPVVTLGDAAVRAFVGDYRIPHPLLDHAHPTSQGTFAMPDHYFELKFGEVHAMRAAMRVIPEVAAELARLSGRAHAMVEPYELHDADRALVVLGSTAGTIKDVVDELRAGGERVGLLGTTRRSDLIASLIGGNILDVGAAMHRLRPGAEWRSSAPGAGGAPPALELRVARNARTGARVTLRCAGVPPAPPRSRGGASHSTAAWSRRSAPPAAVSHAGSPAPAATPGVSWASTPPARRSWRRGRTQRVAG